MFLTLAVSLMKGSKQLLARYLDDGVVVIRSLLDADWVDHLRTASDKLLSIPPPLTSPTGGSLGYTFLWLYSELFRTALTQTPLAVMASRLMQAQTSRLFYDQILAKEPGEARRTLWHQDLPYWPLDGTQMLSFWIALDSVNANNGGVEYIRGSHKWNQVFKPTSHSDSDYWADTPFTDMPEIETMRNRFDIVSWDLEPGDAVAHHPLTIHASFGNQTRDNRRRAYITRWMGDDITFLPRDKTMGFPIDLNLDRGAPMNIGLFPLCHTTN